MYTCFWDSITISNVKNNANIWRLVKFYIIEYKGDKQKIVIFRSYVQSTHIRTCGLSSLPL